MRVSSRFVRFVVLGGVVLAVLVVSPWFWTSLVPGYDFGAPELRAAVEGTWELTVTPKDGPDEKVTFTLSQGSTVRHDHAARTLVRTADACGGRSLVKEAGACLDTTTMPLDVHLIADATAPVGSGELFVTGTRFVGGALMLQVGDVHVDGRVTPTGVVEEVASQRRGGGEIRSRLVRIAR